MRHFISAVAAIAVLALAAACVPPPAHAAVQAMLAWDRCLENGGTVTRTFACDTNEGSETIVGSFVPPAGITDMNGLEVVIDMLTTPETAWPDWWAFKNTGACRQSALSLQFDFQSGEARFRWLHGLPGSSSSLLRAAREHHSDTAWVVSAEQVLDERWFGSKVLPEVRARLGDVALVAREPVAYDDPTDTGPYELIGRHGSMTSAEVYVPLLVAGR